MQRIKCINLTEKWPLLKTGSAKEAVEQFGYFAICRQNIPQLRDVKLRL